jgi:hypothetical protein
VTAADSREVGRSGTCILLLDRFLVIDVTSCILPLFNLPKADLFPLFDGSPAFRQVVANRQW